MSAPGVTFFAALIAGTFAFCYAMDRWQARADWMLDRWWGLPTILLGMPALIIAVASGVAQVTRWFA